jgi:hypothetical protein
VDADRPSVVRVLSAALPIPAAPSLLLALLPCSVPSSLPPSLHKASKDRFLYRGVASPNLIVVEHKGASALPGQFQVVLTSSKYLALAYAMQGKNRLPSKKVGELPQALQVDDKVGGFQAMNYVLDAFLACNVPVFL